MSISLAWLRTLLEWERQQEDTPAALASIRSVALALVQFADSDGRNCHPGQRTLVRECGVRHETVIALRQRWEAAGWLAVDRKGPDRLKTYRLVQAISQRDRSPKAITPDEVISQSDHHEPGRSPKEIPKTAQRSPKEIGFRGEQPPGDLPGDLPKRSNLPDRDLPLSPASSDSDLPGRSISERDHQAPKNGRTKQQDAYLALADSIWSEQERLRRVLRQGGVSQGARDLSMRSEGKLELLRRIAEAASDGGGIERAREDCFHVLAICEAEARESRTLRWFDGNQWRPARWQRAMSMSVEEAAALARSRSSDGGSGERRAYRPTGQETYQGGDELP